MKKFSDFAEDDLQLEGAKIAIEELINKQIIVTNYRINDSKYNDKKCLTVQFRYTSDSDSNIFFTGSEVLRNQLEKYKNEIPFVTTIKKINRYFCFT